MRVCIDTHPTSVQKVTFEIVKSVESNSNIPYCAQDSAKVSRFVKNSQKTPKTLKMPETVQYGLKWPKKAKQVEKWVDWPCLSFFHSF